MATLPAIQQPELRAYPVFDKLPKGCIMFPVVGEAAWPVLRHGEIVVVDTTQRDPIHGELFIIEFGKESGRPSKHLVETFGRILNLVTDGVAKPSLGWMVGAYNRPKTAEEARLWVDQGRANVFCDGPYASEGRNAGYLPSKLTGRVIGILEPSFDETSLRRVN